MNNAIEMSTSELEDQIEHLMDENDRLDDTNGYLRQEIYELQRTIETLHLEINVHQAALEEMRKCLKLR